MTVTTTEWAEENGRPFSFACANDNYEPTRSYAYGEGWEYDRPDDVRGPGIILASDGGQLKHRTTAVYLIDDGRTVRPFYVSGWGPDADGLTYLQPFPTNYDDDGNHRRRADDGRPVDFGTWMLGPRTFYHLKVTFKDGE